MPSAAMVSRSEELSRVAAMLERGGPALVIVRADRGAGRKAFLDEVAEQAAGTHWTVGWRDADGQLAIGPFVTAARFGDRVSRMIDTAGSGASLHRAHSPRAALLRADPSDVEYGAIELGRGLLDVLAEHEPVLLVVDGYAPTSAFARWFGDLVAAIRRRDMRVAIVLGVAKDTGGELLPDGGETVELDRLDVTAIAEHFASLAVGIDPPLSDEELAYYASAAERLPERIGAFGRLLEAAARSATAQEAI